MIAECHELIATNRTTTPLRPMLSGLTGGDARIHHPHGSLHSRGESQSKRILICGVRCDGKHNPPLFHVGDLQASLRLDWAPLLRIYEQLFLSLVSFCWRFLSRTPGPPPFSSMNSTAKREPSARTKRVNILRRQSGRSDNLMLRSDSANAISQSAQNHRRWSKVSARVRPPKLLGERPVRDCRVRPARQGIPPISRRAVQWAAVPIPSQI